MNFFGYEVAGCFFFYIYVRFIEPFGELLAEGCELLEVVKTEGRTSVQHVHSKYL